MCINFGLWLVKLNSLTFAQLANVQTVGIGLYLALAVIQAVTEGGIAGLRRRAITLEAGIISVKNQNQRHEAASIIGDIGSLEMSFQKINRTILYAVITLFTVSILYFAYCTVWQDNNAMLDGAIFILLFYLIFPVIIFAATALHVKYRCTAVDSRIKSLQSDFVSAMFGP